MEFFLQARSFIEREGCPPLALVTVVETTGSVPRHVATRMLVDGEGQTFATIGGGRVEAEVTALARAIARGERAAEVVRHHLVRDLAMCCGGSMTFAVAPLASSDALVDIGARLSRREPLELTSTLETPLEFQPASQRAVPSWDGHTFTESLWPRERAIVFGAGHVSRALLPLLRATDFEIIVCDDNEVGALDDIEGSADRVIASFEPFDVARALGPLGASDFVLILTRDHAIDQRLVEKLLVNDELGYIGLIGSRGKVGRFRRRILAKELVSEGQWQRLSAPIGVNIAAETPAEIAVSICAELVDRRAALRRGLA